MNVIPSRLRRLVATSLLATLALAAPALAQVIVTTSAGAPTENVVSSFSVTDAGASGYQWRNSDSGRRDLGEVFFPAADLDLQKITLQLQSGTGAGARNAAFTLTVLKFSSLSPVTVTETVGQFTGTLPDATFTANTYMTFDISSSNVRVEAGSTYGFLLSFDSQAASRAISFQFLNSANATPFGQRLESTNGTTYSVSTTSLEFHIQATPTAASIPEPSTAALSLGAVALVSGVMQRRRQGKNTVK